MRSVLDLLARQAPSNAVRVRCQRAKGVKVGNNVYLGYDAIIDSAYPELVEIEDHARIGVGVIILAHSRPGDGWMEHLGEERGRVTIKRHAALYAGAIVMPGVTVGEYAIVREGAVVLDDVPPYTVVAGNPARVIEALPRDKATPVAPAPEARRP
jgi:acetyltransferase-like isoleucine patch superfamily enzyme